ncbi:PLD nuclease N-terminal domain-containing protein [Carboxylicivirga sp. N1Y90]|uniref:PLD nuclease N-terminal domain-containing protein n=1 Tax=Carboxylicivirga fragile TaxID=3417571 RepID=UPI003D332F95|nr:PLDc_N domain-containing protein [Marinilabiliaceae bacterium N1Y90]
MLLYALPGGPELILILLALLVLLLPLWALISILKNNFEGSNKIIWVLVVLFLPFLGAILYFTIGRKQRINS